MRLGWGDGVSEKVFFLEGKVEFSRLRRDLRRLGWQWNEFLEERGKSKCKGRREPGKFRKLQAFWKTVKNKYPELAKIAFKSLLPVLSTYFVRLVISAMYVIFKKTQKHLR